MSDEPTKLGWKQVSIPSASLESDYDDPAVLAIEGVPRNRGMSAGLILGRIKMAYFFQTHTEAHEWWDKHGPKLEKHLTRLKVQIYPLQTPVIPN